MKFCQSCKTYKIEAGFRVARHRCRVCERDYGHEYEKANREARRQKAAEYRSKKPHTETQWRRFGNPLRYRMQVYRNGARKRGLAWALSETEAAWLLMEPCFYCGDRRAAVGGIDRIDSTGGYEWSNVVPSCSRCNISKQTMTAVEFIAGSAIIAERFREER